MTLAHKVRPALRDPKASKASPELRDRLARKDRKGRRERPAIRVKKAKRVMRAHPTSALYKPMELSHARQPRHLCPCSAQVAVRQMELNVRHRHQ